MKLLIIGFLSLVLSESIGAEPLIEGRVRLDSGEPVAEAQVRLFDMTDLQRGAIARATTDGTGLFRVALGRPAGAAPAGAVRLGAELSQSVQPLDDHTLSTGRFVASAAGGIQPARTAPCDAGGWRASSGLSHGDVARDGRGWPRRGSGGVHLSYDGGYGASDGADGVG